MELNDPRQQQQHHFTSYFSSTPTTTNTPSPPNGLLPPHHPTDSTTPTGSHLLYPHSMGPSTTATVTGGGAPVEATSAKRKRGRPRKYGTPELALAAKKTATSASVAASRERKEQHQAGSSSTTSSFSGSSSKKSQHVLGTAGHGFTPHVITVAAGETHYLSDNGDSFDCDGRLNLRVPFILGLYSDEQHYVVELYTQVSWGHSSIRIWDDVGQKIIQFLQQSTREMCILSASGSVMNVSLRQPANSGGNISYEGRFEIISLSGSYIRTDMGGRAGGLSVCLSDSNGQIIGGGVGGPLKAAGPVQVIVGTFVLDNKKDGSGKGDASGSKLPSPVKASVPSFGFHLPVESSVRNPARGNDDLLTVGGGNPFTMQPSTMHLLSARTMDWRSSPDVRTTAGYDFTGRTGHGGSQSPVNGGYD
ncbi:AT-hook motif nuclear-localized protein 14-like [Populus alba x Populus x berolinensis]|nr:AT-hook motif nuclear-localized protein 14-like [Populus alba x Populus x berolinensis]